ncbi:MAG: RidA family protein [Acidobacteriota bacterium]
MKNIRSFATIAVVMFGLVLNVEAGQQKEQPKTGPAQSTGTSVEYSSAAGSSSRPLSEFVRVGNVIYLSGKLGTDSTGKLAAGGIAPETKQTLENIRSVLEKNGSSMDQVFKCTVMLADMKEWGEMNSVYTTFFKKERMPARSAFGTSGLALNARVEIECIALMK